MASFTPCGFNFMQVSHFVSKCIAALSISPSSAYIQPSKAFPFQWSVCEILVMDAGLCPQNWPMLIPNTVRIILKFLYLFKRLPPFVIDGLSAYEISRMGALSLMRLDCIFILRCPRC